MLLLGGRWATGWMLSESSCCDVEFSALHCLGDMSCPYRTGVEEPVVCCGELSELLLRLGLRMRLSWVMLRLLIRVVFVGLGLGRLLMGCLISTLFGWLMFRLVILLMCCRRSRWCLILLFGLVRMLLRWLLGCLFRRGRMSVWCVSGSWRWRVLVRRLWLWGLLMGRGLMRWLLG